MPPISAIIITLNEADRIGATIESLDFCDEIVVVDSGSRDLTAEIARRLGARVLGREWRGYAEQKNFAASAALHDWVLSVDADERPAPELAAAIRAWKADGPAPGVVAYSMARRAWYFGKWIRHSGWYPDRKVRLYDRRFGRWTGEIVHEGLEIDGRVDSLAGDLLHFPYRSLREHYERVDRYTTLAAVECRRRGRRFNPLRLLLQPPAHFVTTFVFRAGFLDGWRGLRIAYMGSRYVFLREVRIFSHGNASGLAARAGDR